MGGAGAANNDPLGAGRASGAGRDRGRRAGCGLCALRELGAQTVRASLLEGAGSERQCGPGEEEKGVATESGI